MRLSCLNARRKFTMKFGDPAVLQWIAFDNLEQRLRGMHKDSEMSVFVVSLSRGPVICAIYIETRREKS